MRVSEVTFTNEPSNGTVHLEKYTRNKRGGDECGKTS